MSTLRARRGRRFDLALLALLLSTALGCGEATPSTEGDGPAAGASAAGTSIDGAAKGPRRHIARSGVVKADRKHLRFAYGPVDNPDYEELRQTFRDERFFEEVVAELDRSLVLPRDLEVRLEECDGEVNAFFDGNDGKVHLCYELFEHFLSTFAPDDDDPTDEAIEEAAGKAVAALVFTFYHELGHALIDIYDLPVTGREEDAVDQLATVMLLETWDGEDSELALTASAEWFDSSASEREGEADMADEHALDEQRYFNLLCWTYGSDPEYFADLAADWGLPEGRAERCPDEYQKMSRSWDALLGPHMVAEPAS